MKARVFHIMQYVNHPQTGNILITEECIKNGLAHKSIKRYGYVLHDKDPITTMDFNRNKESYVSQGLSIGDVKPAHYHIILECPNQVELSSISKWFSVPENYIDIPKGRGAFLDCVRYLTHESEKEQNEGKHLYTDDCIVSNFNFRQEITIMEERRLKYGGDLTDTDMLLYDVMYSGKTLRMAMDENNLIYMKNIDKFRKCRGEYLSRVAPMPSHRINYYIEGKGGVGKGIMSRILAKSLYPHLEDEECYFMIGAANATFEDYDGQPVIIWEDCRAVDVLTKLNGRGNTFAVLDPFPKKVKQNVKYSSTTLINSINIINGIQSYEEFLDGLAGEYTDSNSISHKSEDKNQAYRRFPFIIKVREEDFDLLINKGYAEGTREYTQYLKLKSMQASMKRLAQAFSAIDKEKEKVLIDKVTYDIRMALEKTVSTMKPKITEEEYNKLLNDIKEIDTKEEAKEFINRWIGGMSDYVMTLDEGFEPFESFDEDIPF